MVSGASLTGSSAIPIDNLPQFDVFGLLQVALRQIDSADRSVLSGAVVQTARQQIVAILAAQSTADFEPVLRRTAKNLVSVKDPHVESARLALMSAADMLRSPPSEPQAEIPKVGSTDAPGG
jgi:hypothetical protein